MDPNKTGQAPSGHESGYHDNDLDKPKETSHPVGDDSFAPLCSHCMNFVDLSRICGPFYYPRDFDGLALKRSSNQCHLCSTMLWHVEDDFEEVTGVRLMKQWDYDGFSSSIEIEYQYGSRTRKRFYLDV